MSINSLMNTALSGLRASQSSIDTTGNNIANYNIPGYHRQKVILTESISTITVAGFIGNGVLTTGVNRAYSQFITEQLRTAETQNSEITAFYQQMSQIDQLLSNKTGNIAVSIQAFFSGFENVVSNPRDSAAREALLGKAQALVSRFDSAGQFMQQLEKGVAQSMSDAVIKINNYAAEVAELNKQIIQLRGSTGAQPNDLLDKRDHLCSELNKMIGVEIYQQDGDNWTVAFAGGLSLVQGDIAYKVATIASSSDPGRLTMAYDGGVTAPVEVNEDFIQGTLGGLLQFRHEGLDSARNKLGQLALVLADNVNRVNKQGFDLNGAQGIDFFSFSSPAVVANHFNTGTAALSVAYNNTSAVQASDYELRITQLADSTVWPNLLTEWQVTRLADNQVVLSNASGFPLTVDGLTITVTNGASGKLGDRFIVKTVSDVPASIALTMQDSDNIAAAAASTASPTTSAGIGDNRNAQQFLNLQTNRALVETSMTMMDAYASLVADVGSQTSIAKINAGAQANIVGQLYAEQQTLSGVNLDEEYVNLQQLQQYYLANTKVIQTASAMFDALFSMTR